MPWTARDAQKHTKKATTTALKHLWARVANAALDEYNGRENLAVASANAAVKRAVEKKKRT